MHKMIRAGPKTRREFFWYFINFFRCHAGPLATAPMVTVTRLDVGDATGVSVTVTVASLQGRTVCSYARGIQGLVFGLS
jgi:hypothetical protein